MTGFSAEFVAVALLAYFTFPFLKMLFLRSSEMQL